MPYLDGLKGSWKFRVTNSYTFAIKLLWLYLHTESYNKSSWKALNIFIMQFLKHFKNLFKKNTFYDILKIMYIYINKI